MKKKVFSYCIIICSITIVLAESNDFPKLTGPYLGQRLPGFKPERFAQLIFNKEHDCGGFVFSKKMDEVFFFSIEKGKYYINYSIIENKFWQSPQRLNISKTGNTVHPFFSPDENLLLFGSDIRIQKNSRVPYYNLWFMERKNVLWDSPKPLPQTINTGYENCGSFSNIGRLFFRRVSPTTKGDILVSEYKNGNFTEPIKFDEINTPFDESHPAVAPDESYIIFSSKRPGGFNKGKDDLWISFRTKSGRWSDAVNMGKEINNGYNTSCATISPDGKYIFFMRIENNAGIPYWVSVEILGELRKKSLRY